MNALPPQAFASDTRTEGTSLSEGSSSKDTDRSTITALVLAFALIAAMQLALVFTKAVNWDEHFFFGQIVDFTQGESLGPLQTIHVHLFQWLPASVEYGIDGIFTGRAIMLVCALATSGFIAAIAGKFVRSEIAWSAALMWLAAGFSMQHGWSFRTDPLATLLIAGALAVLARSKLSPLWIVMCGAAIGLAGMVTMKTILFAPAFAGLAWLRWSEDEFRPRSALKIAAIPMVALAAFAILFFWHSSSLGDGMNVGAAYAGGASQSMLFAGWPIYLNFAVKAVILSIPAAIALIVTCAVLKTQPKAKVVAILGLLSPLFALLIYRNTLPYFYPMMLAPVVAASAIGVAALAQRYSLKLLVAVTVLSGAGVWMIDGPSYNGSQREIQIAASEIFDEPVGYFDTADMLPQHRKVNGFLTRWGLESIQSRDEEYFRPMLERETVPLLLTAETEKNPTLLAIMLDLPEQVRFRENEREVLRSTYREFWGPFWLAGRDLSPGTREQYEVLVPGPYTVTGGAIMLDGARFELGAVVMLDRGMVSLENAEAEKAGIIWGDNLEAPNRPAPKRPYWRGF